MKSTPSIELLEPRELFAAHGGTSTTTTTTSSTTLSASATRKTASVSATWDTKGLATLSYGGTTLYNGTTHPEDRFWVSSYTFIQPDGSRVTSGAAPISTSFDSVNKILTLNYSWGKVSCQYTLASDRLTTTYSVTNNSTNTLAGINISPLAFRFPKAISLTTPTVKVTDEDPPVVVADYGTGEVALVGESVTQDEYIAMLMTSTTNRWFARVGSTVDPQQPNSWPVFDRPVAPGATDTYTASFRFAASQTPASTIASDIYSAFAAQYPMAVTWSDKRAIATLNPTSAGSRTETNPRGWVMNNIDVTNPTGLADFYTKLMAYADQSIAIMKNMNAQGMITWDIEGEQYDAADYIGDPRLATTLAPELAYNNAAADYFKKFTNAGFSVGVTIRASQVVLDSNGVPTQTAVTDSQLAQNLIDKINYARQNWGATLFYIDSTNVTTPQAVFRQVLAAEPGVLLIPENVNSGDYSVSAPYTTPRLGNWFTPSGVKSMYPTAFCAVNSSDAANNSTTQTNLTNAVKEGDILLFQGWWNNPINALVQNAYAAAGTTGTATPASTTTTTSSTTSTFSSTSILPGTSTTTSTSSSSTNDWLKTKK